MPPKKPRLVTDRERARVKKLHADGLSRNAIAKEIGRPWSTTSKIARELGLSFDRAQTKQAVEARVIDLKAARTQLMGDLLDDAQRLRERAWSEYSYYERGKDEPTKVTLAAPPLGEVRNAYTAIAICVDKHVVLDRHDTDNGSAEAVGVLGRFIDGLQQAARQIDKEGES